MSLPIIPNLSINSLPLAFKPKNSYFTNIIPNILAPKSVFDPGSIRLLRFSNSKGLSVAALGAKNSGQEEGDKRALETVLKLYEAIRNRNKNELADIIGEECTCVCNFITAYQPCYGKQQVLEFFATLMKNLGSHIKFVVEPTSHNGMNVGISWKLEWSKSGVPIGKGFSYYMCHIYQGKVMIRNVEMFMEPLFHIEPLRLKLIGLVTNICDKIGIKSTYQTNLKRALYLLLTAFVTTMFLLFTRLFSSGD